MPSRYFYEFGPFRFFPDEQVLHWDGEEEIRLQPRVSEVLQFLLENRHRLVPRREIMAKVWGVTVSVGPGNLDFQIYLLRKVLNDDPANPTYIRTQKRRGFQFIATANLLSEDIIQPITGHSCEADEKIKESQAVETTDPHAAGVNKRRWVVILLLVLAIVTSMYILFSRKPDKRPAAIITPIGSWILEVPVIADGVKAENNGQKFELFEGDTIEIDVSGTVDIGRGPVGPDGEQGYGDPSMDSPFKTRVGGLEMWIGPDKSSNRYFIGSEFKGRVTHSGIPTFRVIESLFGYGDGNNSGSFRVTLKKKIK